MVKGKIDNLAYSSKRDNRGPKPAVYNNNFDCIVRVVCAREIEEARRRVRTNREGTYYSYTPSREYLNALKRFHNQFKRKVYGEVKQIIGNH